MRRLKPAVRIYFSALANRSKRETCFGKTVERTIYLDPRLANVGRALYHELLHVQHPDWEEAAVSAQEELDWSRMTWKRKAHLYQMLGSAKLEGEE